MTIHLPKISSLKKSKFLLLGIAVGCIAIHLNITGQSGNTDLLINSGIFWFAVCSLVWEKRHDLIIKSGIISSFVGTLLITAVLFNSTSAGINFLYVSPFISAVGIGLLASGFKGLKQYKSELIVLFFLGVPHATLFWLIDLSEFTARFAAFVLWYLGFEVSRNGVYLALNTGVVEVYPGCSGMKNILDLCGIAVLVLVMFPTDWRKKISVPVVAILLAFVVNGARVALMAYLAAYSNQQAFKYWHQGDGSLIFSMISVLIFGLFCFFVLRLDEPKNQDSV